MKLNAAALYAIVSVPWVTMIPDEPFLISWKTASASSFQIAGFMFSDNIVYSFLAR